EQRIFHRTIDVEPPALARNVRRQAEIERRPILREMLARRPALIFQPRNLAGEEFSLARPARLAARQLAFRWRLVLIGHIGTGHSWRCIAGGCLVSRILG